MKHAVATNLTIAVALGVMTGCSTPLRSGSEVDILLEQGMRESVESEAGGHALESYRLARAVAEIDPDYPGVQEALAGIPSDLEHLFDRDLLGSNVAIRQPIDAAWYAHVLWYIPDRILDALDVFSFDVHGGFGLWVDAHATRAAQISAGARSVGGFGWHNNRSLGLQTQAQAGFSLLPFGVEGYSALRAGTSGLDAGTWSESGLHNPTSTIYADYKDYWAVGGGATLLFFGAEADIHPIQVFDFVVGFFLIDPLNDDFASTTGLKLTERERQLMRSLSEIAASKKELEAYFIWRGEQERGAKAETTTASESPEEPAQQTP
jgi:hypothetical protein